MWEWELEFSVLFLLGLWACEVLQVSEKIFRSRFKSGPKGHDCPLVSPDAAIRAGVTRRSLTLSPIISTLARRLLMLVGK
jgi:hypothetical protein